MSEVTTITALRESLLRTYDEIRNDKISLDKANALANHAGKIIKSAVAQVEIARRRGETPDVPFLK